MSKAIAPSAATIWDFPEWVDPFDRFQALIARENGIGAEMRRLGQELDRRLYLALSTGAADPRESKSTVVPTPVRTVSAAARQLLESLRLAPEPPAPAAPAECAKPVTTWDDPTVARLHALAAELESTREAIGVARMLMERAHAEASRKLCEAVRPAYQAVAARVCAALIELGEAKLEHDRFIGHRAEAALGSLRPISTDFQRLGDPREESSGFRRALVWAAESGCYNLSDMPREWRAPIMPNQSARPAALSAPTLSAPTLPAQSFPVSLAAPIRAGK